MSTPTAGRRSTETARTGSSYDFARLERAVAALTARIRELESENSELRSGSEDREQTVRSLELRMGEMSQRREDALKRLDELIERVAGFEAHLERGENAEDD